MTEGIWKTGLWQPKLKPLRKCLNNGNTMNEFATPPNHKNFIAKKLFGSVGEIIDESIAYIDLNGEGPHEKHAHDHNHLFIVTKGEAKSY